MNLPRKSSRTPWAAQAFTDPYRLTDRANSW